jgi:hypothetical protein
VEKSEKVVRHIRKIKKIKTIEERKGAMRGRGRKNEKRNGKESDEREVRG